jgi:hypothetical protein
MCTPPEHCLWICQVCDATSTSESTACSVCYKTTCAAHLRRVPAYNEQNGQYEIVPVCIFCSASEGEPDA